MTAMNLHDLIKVTAKSKKRVGRGLGSGKGKTAGRGTKGQKARGKVSAGFIGGTLPLYKRLPFRRGLGNRVVSQKMVPVSLARLEVFKDGSVVGVEQLVEAGLVTEKKAKKFGVKIVGNGDISKNLTVNVPVSAPAASKIEKAGGKITGV